METANAAQAASIAVGRILGLASAEAAFVTGASLLIDGGASLR